MFAAAVQWAKISDRLKTFPLNARAKSKSAKRKILRRPRYFALFNRGINGLKNYVVPPRNADMSFTYWPERNVIKTHKGEFVNIHHPSMDPVALTIHSNDPSGVATAPTDTIDFSLIPLIP